MQKFSRTSFCIATLFALALAACTPKHDWREVHGTNVRYTVMLPAKPATFSRPINLDGQQVVMTMTAADVDGVTYAVGTATLPDADKARIALRSMKSALVKNIAGNVTREKSSADSAAGIASIDIDALGTSPATSRPAPMRLIVHFVAKDRQVYQVVMLGPEKAFAPEPIDTFFTSFRLD